MDHAKMDYATHSSSKAMGDQISNGLSFGSLNSPPPPITITNHLTRLKAIVERLGASAGQAEASADNLISNAKIAGGVSQTAAPEPSGLLDQMGNALTAAESRLDRLGRALDRIDAAHG